MRIPEWFEKYYRLYAELDDYIPRDYWFRAQRIAWRAYRKGLRDGRKLSSEQLASAEHKGNMNGFKRGRKYGMDKPI